MMSNTERGWFLIAASLIFMGFSPLDAPGGLFVMVVGAGTCAVTAGILFWRGNTT